MWVRFCACLLGPDGDWMERNWEVDRKVTRMWGGGAGDFCFILLQERFRGIRYGCGSGRRCGSRTEMMYSGKSG